MKTRVLWFILLCALSGHAFAEVKFKDSVEVMRIGAYQHSAAHFVWLSVSIPECSTPLSFNETQPGGKALFATLTMALINKRKVGCDMTGATLSRCICSNALGTPIFRVPHTYFNGWRYLQHADDTRNAKTSKD